MVRPAKHLNTLFSLGPLGSLGRSKIALLAGFAAVAVLVMGLAAIVSKTDPDLIFTLGTSTKMVTAPASGYGFATDLMDLSPTALNQRLSDMKATGVTWVRYDLSWANVQPNNAKSFDWSAYDQVTRAATSHGMKVLMIIDFAPTWAQAKGCGSSQICSPADPIQYARFAGAAAQHYKSYGVNYFEIWNEPNTAVRFEPAANPALYTRMLKDSYAAIKRANSNAVVITGGVAPSGTGGGDYSPSDFISAIYKDGAGGWFDAVADHPYTYPVDPAQSVPADAWGQLTTIRNIMTTHDDGNKQIWVTEFGAPTNGPDPTTQVREAAQAKMATDAINIFHSYSWGGPFLWYDYMDAGTDTSTNENFYGLVRADGTHKPAYAAFVNAITANQ